MKNRQTIRLPGYDYSLPGAYFVTICTQNRKHLFGNITDGKMQLNEFGGIVKNQWIETEKLRPNIMLDTYIIMPNHFHGIVCITSTTLQCTGTACRAPTEQFGKPMSGTLPTIIRSFKSSVTKYINQLRNTPNTTVWQRNYYERIIRNEIELNHVRQYIKHNPHKWQSDNYY